MSSKIIDFVEFSNIYESKNPLKLLNSNRKRGFSRNLKLYYEYSSPDAVHYHQWFWDSCFHSMVYSKYDVVKGVRELQSLFSVQEENGFVPHIILWKLRLIDAIRPWWIKEVTSEKPFYTGEIQPPVAGISIKMIYDRIGKPIHKLKSLIDKMFRYYIYLSRFRDPDEDGLVSIITPLESGMDMLPSFDLVFENTEFAPHITKKMVKEMLRVYKGMNWNTERIFRAGLFDVEDTAFNTIYILGLRGLEYVLRNYNDERYQEIKKIADRAEKALVDKMWNSEDGIFYSLMHRGGKEIQLRVKTVSSLFPLLLAIPQYMKSSLIEYIRDRKHFWCNYPIPSVSLTEKGFGPLTETRFLWRGTTWINTNYFLWKGLRTVGEKKLANTIVERSWELVKRYGFCEFYDPFSGEPGRAMKNFGWSTLISLMFIET